MQFSAGLSIYVGRDRALSKDEQICEFADVMNNSASLKFDTLKKLNKNINDLINYNIHMQKKEVVNSEIQNLNHPNHCW